MAEKIPKTSGKERKEEPAVNKEGKKVRKSEREKRRREDAVDEELNEESTESQKKKHKKNKTGFPDPNEDSSLSEQASKALSYAFTQFRKPSKWKFHKARQNWIIRNIWSDTIPDTYVELTIRYLSNVKGGVREKLIQDCQSVLSTSADKNGNLSAEEIPEAEPVTAGAATETNELKHKRARTLLDALETSENGSK
ncbi:hypothetical protein B0H11DRAFT_1705475 [Mycena galericulata]|nr:hypothetical protein B0H11DRAFT_1705475 [Mycena galericulata]